MENKNHYGGEDAEQGPNNGEDENQMNKS
ncbi:hypothetical protein A2U01_0026241, partial [Trifolium medium]|nr:hypothetical protein [Trifolium medium]